MHTRHVEIFGAGAILPRPAVKMPEPGDLLVSTPSTKDPNWRRVVVLMLANDSTGTVGVILNRRAALQGGAIPDWLISADEVLIGGPVSPEGLIGIGVPHPEFATSRVLPGIAVIDLDRLESEGVPAESATGGAFRWRLFAGYAGWGSKQLRDEIERGDWAVVGGKDSDVLDSNPDEIWRGVLLRQSHPIRLWASLPDAPDMN
jgi:putative transcriptional regulator